MNEGQTKDYETTARLCAVSGSCLVQLPRSFIDSFIKGRTNVRVENNEGQSVSVCSVYSATTSLFPSAASRQSLYTLFRYFIEFILWKRTNWSIEIQTRSVNGKPMMRSVELGCGKQTASILFSVRICSMFLISKCRGEFDLQ